MLKVILSRAARSARMIAHFEVDYPKRPYSEDYWCIKHERTCHPTKDAYGFLKRYCLNTVDRIEEFQRARRDVFTEVLHGDSRTSDFSDARITDVFTSPPYLGLIDYHEQHRYAYELLGIEDNSMGEIGPKRLGASRAAAREYKDGIVKVIRNITESSFDRRNGRFILVVNDKLGLYEEIVGESGMRIVKNYVRRVERRSGRRAGGFSENVLVCRVDRDGR